MEIQKLTLDDPYTPWRVEAVATAAGQRFSCVHDRLLPESSKETVQQFEAFEALSAQLVEISLTEGGRLRLERNSRGHITVHYRISGWKARAALDGEVLVEGEFANSFCREFGALLKGVS